MTKQYLPEIFTMHSKVKGPMKRKQHILAATLVGLLLSAVCGYSYAGPTLTCGGMIANSAESVSADGGVWTLYKPSDSTLSAAGVAGAYSSGYWAGEAGAQLDGLDMGVELICFVEKETQTGTPERKGYFAVMNHTLTNQDPAKFDNCTLRAIPSPSVEVSGTEAVLTWEAASEDSSVANIVGYNIYRSRNGVLFEKINQSPIAQTTFTDQNYPSDTIYYAAGLAYRGTPKKEGEVLSAHSDPLLDVELTVAVPNAAAEGDGVLADAGTVSIATPLGEDLSVNLASSDDSELELPDTVVISAGQVSATFDLTVIDDELIDGIKPATVTASAMGYIPGQAGIAVFDNEAQALALTLPDCATEGDGLLEDAGTISVSGVLVEDLFVDLSSDDLSEVSVPATVVISAGERSATFDLSIEDDDIVDGTQTATIRASASGWTSAENDIHVFDNDSQEDPVVYVSPVGNCDGNQPCYSSIQYAIDAAPSGSIIKICEGDYDEPLDVVLNLPKQIILQGSWESSYTTRQGESTIKGTVILSNGVIIVDQVQIQ